MDIKVKQRKIVADKDGHNHRGKHDSLAVDEDGYRAWGFGDTELEADKNAFSKTRKLRKS